MATTSGSRVLSKPLANTCVHPDRSGRCALAARRSILESREDSQACHQNFCSELVSAAHWKPPRVLILLCLGAVNHGLHDGRIAPRTACQFRCVIEVESESLVLTASVNAKISSSGLIEVFGSGARWRVGIAHILRHHALSVEERTVEGDGGAHHLSESIRLVIVERQDHLFELMVQR